MSAGTRGTGPQREQMYTHEFVGGNSVMTELLGSKKHGALSVKLLQNAASISGLLLTTDTMVTELKDDDDEPVNGSVS